MKVILTENNIASFVLTSIRWESIPEPYRMQPSVNFVIPFETYIAFLQKYLGETDVFLFKTEDIKECLNNIEIYRHRLFRMFQKDVAIAMLKEVYFAESYGKCASNITHLVRDAKLEVSRKDLQGVADNITKLEQYSILKILKQRGYDLHLPVSERNIDLYNYAMTLWYMSSIKAPYWTLKDSNEA